MDKLEETHIIFSAQNTNTTHQIMQMAMYDFVAQNNDKVKSLK